VSEQSPPHPGLQLDDDPTFAHRQFRVQQVGLALLGLFLAAALVGVFGEGPVAQVDRRGADGVVAISMDRFVRSGANESLAITIAGGQASHGEVQVAITTDWLNAISLAGISPQPAQIEARDDQQVLVFAVDDPAAPLVVEIGYGADYIGRRSLTVAVGTHDPVRVWQVAFP